MGSNFYDIIIEPDKVPNPDVINGYQTEFADSPHQAVLGALIKFGEAVVYVSQDEIFYYHRDGKMYGL